MDDECNCECILSAGSICKIEPKHYQMIQVASLNQQRSINFDILHITIKVVDTFCRDAPGSAAPQRGNCDDMCMAALGCGAPKRFCISALKCQQGNEGCLNFHRFGLSYG
jgi:hypothetical protein